ncbi:MAG: DUF814 domain-containing protein [Candidatus Latescibacteria bacterium]|nr:DUF814 domain-containing protein [Candidatus Latescibacterota bacterium]
MSTGPHAPPALEGRRVRGVVAFSTRSLAISFQGDSRAYLWIHAERKDAWWALAPRMPIPPDPRGSRFQPMETALRGAEVAEVRSAAEGGLELRLLRAGEVRSGEAREGLRLTLAAESARANLALRSDSTGQVLWALHREEAPREAPHRPPPTHRLPAIHDASAAEAREALRERIARAFQLEFDAEISRILAAARRALRRRIEGAEEDMRRAREMREGRRRAEILLSSFSLVPRGASRVELPDPFADSPQATVEILLDPALSPEQNANRLFQRAKKGERGEILAERRLSDTRKSLAKLEALRDRLTRLAPTEALAEIRNFLAEAALELSARGDMRETHLGRQAVAAPRAGRPRHRPPGARESVRPRTYVTSDGWEVWVGRSNTENDLITHRMSNPHDYWFHVVGAPGSHVILRRPARNSTPKPSTLAEAAQIAAYFSKARKQSRVPVIYTERKFVSKPKRAKPGQALCTRERELLVRPRKPDGAAGKHGIDREVSS